MVYRIEEFQATSIVIKTKTVDGMVSPVHYPPKWHCKNNTSQTNKDIDFSVKVPSMQTTPIEAER